MSEAVLLTCSCLQSCQLIRNQTNQAGGSFLCGTLVWRGLCSLTAATKGPRHRNTHWLLINRFSFTRREISSPRLRRLCVLLLTTAVPCSVQRSLGASPAAVRGHQRVSPHRLPRCSHCRLPCGQSTGRIPPLPTTSFRTLLEASRWRSPHSLHQTQSKFSLSTVWHYS